MFDLCGIEKFTMPVTAKSALDFVGPEGGLPTS
jgi:hypothetical protein